VNDVLNFLERLGSELLRSLGETFGIFSVEGKGPTISLEEVLVRLLTSALLLVIFFVGYRLLKRLLHATLSRGRLAGYLRQPLLLLLRYAAVLLTALAIFAQFGVDPQRLAKIGIATVFTLLFYAAWLLLSRTMTSTMRRYGFDRSLEQLLRNVLAVLLLTVGLITVLGQFGVNVISVVTTLGVVGIAVGFAAQETLSNFIAGITLLIERPFRIGDWVELGGKIGRIEEITLRTTRLVTRDNVLTSIPNAMVASGEILNFSAGGPLRVSIPIGIAYQELAQAAREAILPVVGSHPAVLADPNREPQLWFEELADSSLNLRLLYWIAPEDIAAQPLISSEILEGCKDALDHAGIEIPFPHLQLYIDDAQGLRPLLEPLYPTRIPPD